MTTYDAMTAGAEPRPKYRCEDCNATFAVCGPVNDLEAVPCPCCGGWSYYTGVRVVVGVSEEES